MLIAQGIALYLNLFFTHFIVPKQRADGNSSEFIVQWVERVSGDRACFAEKCTASDFRKRRNWKDSYC